MVNIVKFEKRQISFFFYIINKKFHVPQAARRDTLRHFSVWPWVFFFELAKTLRLIFWDAFQDLSHNKYNRLINTIPNILHAYASAYAKDSLCPSVASKQSFSFLQH